MHLSHHNGYWYQRWKRRDIAGHGRTSLCVCLTLSRTCAVDFLLAFCKIKSTSWSNSFINHNKFSKKKKKNPHSQESELTHLSEIQKSFKRTALPCIYAATRVGKFPCDSAGSSQTRISLLPNECASHLYPKGWGNFQRTGSSNYFISIFAIADLIDRNFMSYFRVINFFFLNQKSTNWDIHPLPYQIVGNYPLNFWVNSAPKQVGPLIKTIKLARKKDCHR